MVITCLKRSTVIHSQFSIVLLYICQSPGDDDLVELEVMPFGYRIAQADGRDVEFIGFHCIHFELRDRIRL